MLMDMAEGGSQISGFINKEAVSLFASTKVG